MGAAWKVSNKGEEVCGVVEQTGQIDRKAFEECLGQVDFDGLDLRSIQIVHTIRFEKLTQPFPLSYPQRDRFRATSFLRIDYRLTELRKKLTARNWRDRNN